MIKILTAAQIKAADAYTIQHEPIASIRLMERAVNVFTQHFLQDFPIKETPKFIFCGNGNNGGDGLAVARLLLDKTHNVSVYTFPAKQYSKDYLQNLKRLQRRYKKHLHIIKDAAFIEQLPPQAIIIDAIFGTGLNKSIQKNTLYFKVIEQLNQRHFSHVVAIDIPSGVAADSTLQSIAVKANKTYTFQFPKLSFLLPKSGIFANEFNVLDIGLHKNYIQSVTTDKYFMEEKDIKERLKQRSKYSHKGTYGHALLIAGSYGKMGAAILSSKATLRSGAGLVSAHIPACGYSIYQTAFPEAMCITDTQKNYISSIPKKLDFDTIAIGPGIGTHTATIHTFSDFIQQQKQPIIIDADGLNILAKEKTLLKSIPNNSILTPHPKEFERLVGKWENDIERLNLQQNFSKQHKVITILKGAHTSISTPDGTIYFNSSGNAGMATAGSGDVLTGILAGLLAQGYTPVDASCIGVFLHGRAADIALNTQSMESLIASDIINHIGNAYKSLQ